MLWHEGLHLWAGIARMRAGPGVRVKTGHDELKYSSNVDLNPCIGDVSEGDIGVMLTFGHTSNKS